MIEIQANFISIHKALAGLDWSEFGIVIVLQYFNPQGPRGPRPLLDGRLLRSCRFQSTRPSRASTPRRRYTPTVSPISIHKALAGLDSPMQYIYKSTGQFQSTRPSRASTPTNIDFRIF